MLSTNDFDHIALGIRDSLLKTVEVDIANEAVYLKAADHQRSVLAVAKNIAARMGENYLEFDLENFVNVCAMSLGSDGVWRVAADTPYFQVPHE